MKSIPALAGALALFLLLSPEGAGAQTYQHDTRVSDDVVKAKVIGWRHTIRDLRQRTWHYQDMRKARRSETRHLERNVHRLDRLHRIAHYWWRSAVKARRAALAYQRAQERAAARPVIDSCTRALITRENPSWDPHRYNAQGSGAYGLPQALPGSKMASAGADWADNPATQIRWMIGYMNSTYGGSCAALAHSYAYGWY